MDDAKFVVIKVSPKNELYKDLIAIKTVMKFVDFGCENGKGGFECVRSRVKNKKMCCHECADNFGFLRVIPKYKLKMYMEKFDKESGFLTSTGCSLPIEDRSPKCLTYNCQSTRALAINNDSQTGSIFNKGMQKIKELMESIENKLIKKYK